MSHESSLPHGEPPRALDDTNRELRRRISELQTLLDVLPVGIGIAGDRECREIRMNRAFAEILGIDPAANASKTAPDGERPTTFRVRYPDGREIADADLPMQIAARDGVEVRGVEFDIVHDSGRVVRLLEYAAPLFDEHGTSRGSIGAFVDVTASHQAKRRDQFLVRLDDATRHLGDPAAIADAFLTLLVAELHLDRAELGDVSTADPLALRMLAAHPGIPATPGGALRTIPPEPAGRLKRGEVVPDEGAALIPLVHDGRLVAAAWLVRAGARWTAGDLGLAVQGARRYHDRIDRARVTRTLTESEERYRRIFETAGVSIWEEDFSEVKAALDELEARGVTDIERYLDEHPAFVERCLRLVKVLDVNEASVRMFRAPSKHALLDSLQQVFTLETRRVFVGELVAMARGEHRFESEATLKTLDGRALHVMFTVTFPEPGGSFRSVLVSMADISERKAAETALEQEVEIRKALASVGASLAGELQTDRLVQAVTDAGTRLTSAEFGALFYEPLADSGEPRALYAVAGAPRAAFGRREGDELGPALRAGRRVRVDDITCDPHDGPHAAHHGLHGLPVRSHLAVPVVARGGRVLGGLFFWHRQPGIFTAQHEQLAMGVASWAAIALDNARLYRDVEHANRLKDEFLATLSHELRTPLNAVLGWAHILRGGGVTPDVQQRALEAVERNARAQAQLVEDLLDVSRIMSGKLQIKSDPVDLGAVVGNAVETVRPAAAAKRVGMTLRVRPGVRVLVTGDADRLQQIVWNLLSNAIKFTPAGGLVELELRPGAALADIVVHDTGQGFAPGFRRHLFERFRQSDSSTVRRHGGLGLGLSIVRHLTEAHGGVVDAESAGEGLGATFTVTLPIRAVETADAPEPSGDTAVVPAVLTGIRVLAVDDEADARELIRYLLESRGAQVFTATSVGEALHVIGTERLDLLVADIGMPDQDGYSLVRLLRSLDERSATLPAIAVTAYASPKEREQALAAGFGWHVAKPVDPDQLVATVRTALAGRTQRE